jgi:hypothetical protein
MYSAGRVVLTTAAITYILLCCVCRYDNNLAMTRVFLKARWDLPEGTEVFVSYGRTYWKIGNVAPFIMRDPQPTAQAQQALPAVPAPAAAAQQGASSSAAAAAQQGSSSSAAQAQQGASSSAAQALDRSWDNQVSSDGVFEVDCVSTAVAVTTKTCSMQC